MSHKSNNENKENNQVHDIVSKKKKIEKKKTDSQGRPTRNCIILRNKNWLDKWKGWLKIDFQDSGEKSILRSWYI